MPQTARAPKLPGATSRLRDFSPHSLLDVYRGWRIHGVLCHVCDPINYHSHMVRQRHYYDSITFISSLPALTAAHIAKGAMYDAMKGAAEFE